MINTFENLSNIGLVLYDLITIVFCTTSWARFSCFLHKGMIDNELLTFSQNEAAPIYLKIQAMISSLYSE